MVRIEVHGVLRQAPAPVVVERLARVRVDVESRETAAGDVQSDPVIPLKDERGRIHFDRELVRLTRLDQLGFARPASISRPYDAVRDVEIDAGREIRAGRIDVDELGG